MILHGQWVVAGIASVIAVFSDHKLQLICAVPVPAYPAYPSSRTAILAILREM